MRYIFESRESKATYHVDSYAALDNNNDPIMVPDPQGGKFMVPLKISRSVPKRVGKTLRDKGGKR